MSIASRNKPNPKKKYSRLEITQAGRERLSRQKQKAGGYGDSGINPEGINWEMMRIAGEKARAGMSNAERMADDATASRNAKLMKDAEKKSAYQAGLGVNMKKRAVKKSYRDQQAKQDASILRQRGVGGSGGTNPADKTSPSNVQSVIDFFRDPGDKRYGSTNVSREGKKVGGYYERRTMLTSQERRLAKLRAKGKKRPNATL